MAARRQEISLLVLKYFLTLEEKLPISARPCNILYVIYRNGTCGLPYAGRML